ncbi:MAG: hypothetical protein JWO94_3284, partial [Verrucomicrobiaceae bacterium]|nr:hypothetical protein [Verrucomicrobiaceae bacterium]
QADAAAGGQFQLGDLDLVQKRTHILQAAIDHLPEKSRQLLGTLALLSGAVDYTALLALNPHLPPEPVKVEVPVEPTIESGLDEAAQTKREDGYREALKLRAAYEQAMKEYRQAPAVRSAPAKLDNTLDDLERRGLLQYDARQKHYDLHPVARCGGGPASSEGKAGLRAAPGGSFFPAGPQSL